MKVQELVKKFNEVSEFLEYDEFIYDLDQPTVNDLFTSPWDMLLMVKFGEVNMTHEYFTFDGYGNIKTLSDNDIKEMLSNIVYDNMKYLTDNFEDDIDKYLI